MNPYVYLISKAHMTLRLNEASRRAESRDLLCLSQGNRQGWLVRQSCRLLCQLGRLLKTWGKQLEQLGTPGSLSQGKRAHRS